MPIILSQIDLNNGFNKIRLFSIITLICKLTSLQYKVTFTKSRIKYKSCYCNYGNNFINYFCKRSSNTQKSMNLNKKRTVL